MKTSEICERYFREFGHDMLREKFPDLVQFTASGLFGSGSECLGYDDDISSDHDLEPGFCIFIPGEDVLSSRDEFRLERAYSALPKEFMGLKRGLFSPVGGPRRGVIRYDDFFKSRCGSEDGILTIEQWLHTPEYYLLECTNGAVYEDNYGQVTEIRERLAYMPEDIRLKKLAGNLLIMAQAGQYNYTRCVKHGETAAAQLAVFAFTQSALNVIFLINKRYTPFYKWIFRAMRDLPRLSDVANDLETLMTTENDGEIAEDKYYTIEDIAAKIIEELLKDDLSAANCGDLEKHAYSVNDKITDGEIRNLHILTAV